jgi:LysR family transcriptional regulator, pca operon transcriptional activator
MLDRIRLRQLRLFVELARTGSVRRVGKQLGIKQPLVTRLIQDLEKSVGSALFERDRRGVTLNEYGQLFLRHALVAISELQSGIDHIRQVKAATLGHVSIGVSVSELHRLVPSSIARLNTGHPGVLVTVVQGTAEDMLAKLRSGTIDVLAGLKAPAPSMQGLAFEALFVERYVLVARAGHPLAAQRQVTLSNLIEYPWVVPRTDSDLRPQFEALFRESNVRMPAKTVIGLIALFARDFVMQSDAIAPIPYSFVAEEISSGRLVQFDVGTEIIHGTVGITILADAPPSEAAALLIAELRRTVAVLELGKS